MEHAAAMLAADPEIAKALITHRFPIEDAGEAFVRQAAPDQSGHPKLVLDDQHSHGPNCCDSR